MTINLGIKYSVGVIIATDSRITYGNIPLMRHEGSKIECLNNQIAITSDGLVGPSEKIIKEIKMNMSRFGSLNFDEFIKKVEDFVWKFYERYNERIIEDETDEEWGLQLFSKDRMVTVAKNGTSQEDHRYLCAGSAGFYAEYILGQRYNLSLTEQKAKELAVYTVAQTALIDPNVGGLINLAIVDKMGCRLIKQEEILKIKEQISFINLEETKKLQSLVKEIVENRRWINDLFNNRFKNELLEQNEIAISQIQKDCTNEDDFTNRIAALALLIDQMKIPKPEQQSKEPGGSINKLEVFVNSQFQSFNSEGITILRDIMTLRSKKMPIHKDDPRIIQVILNWGLRIPPDWSLLWIEALKKYNSVLKMLKESLETRKQN